VLTCPRIRAAVTSGFYTEIAAQPKATNGRQYPACLARTKPAIAYRVFSLVVSRGGALYLWKRRGEGLPSYRDAARQGRRAIQRLKTIRRREGSGNWKPTSQAWKASWGGAAWKSVFSKVTCEEWRDYARTAMRLAEQHLRRDLRLGVARPN
jgi:hypothetical protein